MLKSLSCAAALMLAAPFASADDARLTDTETRWIAAGMSVVRYARSVDLPVDIVVQPGNEPDASPIAIGIKDGRCKLVLSMRGNPGSTALVASVPPAYFDAVVGAVFAHEIGHCWRYVQGEWNAAPSGFADAGSTGVTDPRRAGDAPPLQESRRESVRARRAPPRTASGERAASRRVRPGRRSLPRRATRQVPASVRPRPRRPAG